MKQEHFVALYGAQWAMWERWLYEAERKARSLPAPAQPQTPAQLQPQAPAQPQQQALDFPAAYRRLCYHFALARSRGYSHEIIDRLQRIVQQGHRLLYRPPAPRWHRVADFLVAGFPRLVRSQWRYIAVAAVLFYLPLVVSLSLLWWRPEWAHSVFSRRTLTEYESMYDPANIVIGRNSGTDVQMFGYYIINNISIAFRMFASGLVFGVGSIFVLILNGISIGGLAGYLTAVGCGGPFWRYVVAHGAFELTAFVIAGGAGLRLGLTLLAPGRQRRGPALVAAGWVGAQLALGVSAMLVVAASIEAFWSSIASLSNVVKYGSAAALWTLVLFWLGWGGRDDGA